jgi:hypothetical protein
MKFMQGSSEKYCMYEKTSKNWIIEEFIKENTCTTHLGNCCLKNTFYLQNNELFPTKNWIDLDLDLKLFNWADWKQIWMNCIVL